MINLQNSDIWKIQLTSTITFISSRDSEEKHIMHLGRDNIKFTTYSYANYVIEKIFNSHCSKYQGGLETSMKGSDFIFRVSSTNVLQVS